MRRYAIVVVCLVVSLVLATTVFREPVARAAQGVAATIISPLDGSGYVAVHEQGTASVAVTNFPATQPVAVTNFPATQQAAATVQISSGYLDASTPWVEFDATPYAKVRITTKLMDLSELCVGGATILVYAPYMLQIATFSVSPGQDASQLLEVPGTDVRVTNAKPACQVAYSIFGRRN